MAAENFCSRTRTRHSFSETAIVAFWLTTDLPSVGWMRESDKVCELCQQQSEHSGSRCGSVQWTSLRHVGCGYWWELRRVDEVPWFLWMLNEFDDFSKNSESTRRASGKSLCFDNVKQGKRWRQPLSAFKRQNLRSRSTTEIRGTAPRVAVLRQSSSVKNVQVLNVRVVLQKQSDDGDNHSWATSDTLALPRKTRERPRSFVPFVSPENLW